MRGREFKMCKQTADKVSGTTLGSCPTRSETPPEVKIMSAFWNKARDSFWEDLAGILFTPAVLIRSDLQAGRP